MNKEQEEAELKALAAEREAMRRELDNDPHADAIKARDAITGGKSWRQWAAEKRER